MDGIDWDGPMPPGPLRVIREAANRIGALEEQNARLLAVVEAAKRWRAARVAALAHQITFDQVGRKHEEDPEWRQLDLAAWLAEGALIAAVDALAPQEQTPAEPNGEPLWPT